MRRIRSWWDADRGDAALEAVLLAPALLMLLILAIVAGRFYTAQSAVAEAARAAARSASLATDGATAAAVAQTRASSVLAAQGLQCSSLTVVVDTADFAIPVGQTGYVTATVTCEVRFSDLVTPGLAVPGSRTASASFRSPIDRYGPHP